jgi:hypothetical protein
MKGNIADKYQTRGTIREQSVQYEFEWMPIQDQSILSFGLKARFKMLIII